MVIIARKLSIEMIEYSRDIQSWLNQFSAVDRIHAVDLLHKLQFVSRDTYSEWLKSKLLEFQGYPSAIYVVRKLDDEKQCLWDEIGRVVTRPGSSLGSEDLVYSIVSNFVKSNPTYIDHPSLEELKSKRVHNILLLDDSINSGKRVSSFVNAMMKNKTIISWWSYGLIDIHIIAFARAIEADKFILQQIPGSNHPMRKKPKSQKVHFRSHYIYQKTDFSNRWGANFQSIIDLCNSSKAIPSLWRMGFGRAMSNIVFYHSVPNNTPGMLWFQDVGWNPLFPRRSVPDWLPQLLEGNTSCERQEGVPRTLIMILQLIKSGIRKRTCLALETGFDVTIIDEILALGTDLGLITKDKRLTETGLQVFFHKKTRETLSYDRSLYIPTKWCVGQGTVQPSGLMELP